MTFRCSAKLSGTSSINHQTDSNPPWISLCSNDLSRRRSFSECRLFAGIQHLKFIIADFYKLLPHLNAWAAQLTDRMKSIEKITKIGKRVISVFGNVDNDVLLKNKMNNIKNFRLLDGNGIDCNDYRIIGSHS